jgi:hypothetical protein
MPKSIVAPKPRSKKPTPRQTAEQISDFMDPASFKFRGHEAKWSDDDVRVIIRAAALATLDLNDSLVPKRFVLALGRWLCAASSDQRQEQDAARDCLRRTALDLCKRRDRKAAA